MVARDAAAAITRPVRRRRATVARALGRRPRLLPVPIVFLRAALTSSDQTRLTGSLTVSIAKLSARTGFAPLVTPDQGWEATASWYRTLR